MTAEKTGMCPKCSRFVELHATGKYFYLNAHVAGDAYGYGPPCEGTGLAVKPLR